MIKGVAFDLEGTVINLEHFHFHAFARAVQEMAPSDLDLNNLNLSDAESFERILPGAIGGGDVYIARGICKHVLGRLNQLEQLIVLKKYYFEKILLDIENIQPRVGFIEIYEQIARKGLSLSLTSITPREQGLLLLKQAGIRALFREELIFLGDSVKNIKPAPDIYHKSAEQMQISTQEQLVFEDSVPGVRAAVSAGSGVVAMPIYYFQSNISNLMEVGADRIFASWSDILIDEVLCGLNSKR